MNQRGGLAGEGRAGRHACVMRILRHLLLPTPRSLQFILCPMLRIYRTECSLIIIIPNDHVVT